MQTDTPKHYPIAIKAAPKIGNLYWCNFHDAKYVHLPEMWKTRPVLIVSKKNFLKGKIMVLPLSTEEDNAKNINAYKLPSHISKQISGMETWVICDHITTIATSRLRQINGKVPRLIGNELDEILRKMCANLGGT